MSNKHGAGCTCCRTEGDCSPCAKTITNIAITLDGETVSWSVNKGVNAIPGCVLLLEHCTTPVVYDLIDYSAVTAWDGRTGDCWKPFADFGTDCCDPQGGTGEGGGPGGGPGGPPIPADVCIPCGTWLDAPPDINHPNLNWPCQGTEFYITTFKVHDVTSEVKLKIWTEYTLQLIFSPAGANQSIQVNIDKKVVVDRQWKVKFSVTGYYNDNCPRDEDCIVTGAVCDETFTGVGGDVIYGFYWCEYGMAAPNSGGSLKDTRTFNCAEDAPNWVEITTSTYCNDMTFAVPVECMNELSPCQAGDRDADADWETARPSNSTCAVVNYLSYTTEQIEEFNDWIFQQIGRPFAFDSSIFPFSDFPLTADCGGIGSVGGSSRCNNECPPIVYGSSTYFETIEVSCSSLCGAHTIDGVAGNAAVSNISLTFNTCPVAQCSRDGNTDPEACTFWQDACCEGTDPAPVTISVGYTPAATATLTISCAP